jgi:hypothetical protein
MNRKAFRGISMFDETAAARAKVVATYVVLMIVLGFLAGQVRQVVATRIERAAHRFEWVLGSQTDHRQSAQPTAVWP